MGLQVTNAVIDFANETEATPLLQGAGDGGGERPGWADPSLLHVGSASLNVRSDMLEREPCTLRCMWRELSLITTDCPTSLKDDSKSFYGKVVRPLVDLVGKGDNLYTWLEVMFGFAALKPVAYFSRYKPSQRVERIAAKHRVRLVPIPLRRIPAALLERNRSFRFFNLTRSQWEALQKGIAEGRGAWALG